MNLNILSKAIILSLGCSAMMLASENFSDGDIGVLHAQRAILNTEFSKQALEDLQSSVAWKEASEEFQTKMTEANEISEKFKKEEPTMSEEEKIESQKRVNSLAQDIQFLQQKMNQMQNETANQIIQQQQARFLEIVNDYTKAMGIKILLREEATLAFNGGDPSLNITPQITELMNQKEE